MPFNSATCAELFQNGGWEKDIGESEWLSVGEREKERKHSPIHSAVFFYSFAATLTISMPSRHDKRLTSPLLNATLNYILMTLSPPHACDKADKEEGCYRGTAGRIPSLMLVSKLKKQTKTTHKT